MYDELIQRLKYAADIASLTHPTWTALMTEAADAIEKLQLYVDLYKDLTEKGEKVAREVLDKYPKWIPVTERLPETKEIVQITDGINVGHGYLDGTWHSPFCDIDVEHISHWMPLPEPPKEKA